MLRRLGSHLRNQWMGALALFLVLSGGTAYAAATIGSDDIVDGSIRSIDLRNDEIRTFDVRDDTQTGGGLVAADLGPGSVGVSELDAGAFAALDIAQDSPTSPFEIADNAIQHTEVSDGTLRGADVAPDTLTGAQVDEASLAGLDGHDAYRDLCDTPSDNSFKDCLSVTFELGRAMQVLVVYGGGGSHGSYGYAEHAVGECKTKLDGTDRLNPVNLINDHSVPVGMATITDVMTLAAGTHTVTLACREDPSDMEFEDLTIGVVELSVD